MNPSAKQNRASSNCLRKTIATADGRYCEIVSVSNNDKYSNIQSYIQSNGLEHVHVFKDIRKGRFVTPQVVFELLHRLFRSLGLGLSLCLSSSNFVNRAVTMASSSRSDVCFGSFNEISCSNFLTELVDLPAA